MSTTEFVEATSADPFVRDLHRKAVRLLNDPSLDRKQRELHIGRLQSILLEHQAKQAAKAAQREQVSRINRNQGVADPSQVVARRKEFGSVAKEQEQVREQLKEQVNATERAGSVVEKTPQAAPSGPAGKIRAQTCHIGFPSELAAWKRGWLALVRSTVLSFGHRMISTAARVIYPELPDPLTPDDLQQLFSPSFDERHWAPTVARTAASQVALLVQLKIFQTIGRFRRAADVPPAVIEHVALRLGVESGSTLIFPDRTLYRHRPAILKRLGVILWGTEARELVQATMRKTAQARTDPADIINSAIDALIRHGFELPALDTLRRLAATVHSKVNAAQWNEVCDCLPFEQRVALETMLVVDSKTQKSPFANLCAAPGRASRKNLNALIDRYQWLQQLPDPATALQSIADSKILQWSNEAKRLNALELRQYITPRRYTLLMAVIHDTRGQVLDDLTQMLLRLVRKIEWKSSQRLAQWHQTRRSKTDVLIRTFHDSLIVHGAKLDAAEKVSQVETVFAAQGGREALAQSCEEHLRYKRQNWRPFARAVFVPLRSALLRLVGILPLQGTATAAGLLSLVRSLTNEESPRSDYSNRDSKCRFLNDLKVVCESGGE